MISNQELFACEQSSNCDKLSSPSRRCGRTTRRQSLNLTAKPSCYRHDHQQLNPSQHHLHHQDHHDHQHKRHHKQQQQQHRLIHCSKMKFKLSQSQFYTIKNTSWAMLLLFCFIFCGFTSLDSILLNNGSPTIRTHISSQSSGYNMRRQQRSTLIGQAYAIQAPASLQPQAMPPQSSINSIQGLHQAMTQMLQVFNGNDSSQLDTNNFKILEQVGEDTLLVGARNFVYNLSLTTMREQRRLEWTANEDDAGWCHVKGKSTEQCQNYIRVIKVTGPQNLLVCGTNAYKPRCRNYFIGTDQYELSNEQPGEGACPYQENQNVTSTFADGHLYSATAAQFSGIDGLIHKDGLRTEQFNPKQLNSPNFVSSFQYGEHVYFLFREIAIEHINCGKTIYSRIARVCINDNGGPTTRNRERWTSFVKARLNCSIPGDFPFYFDEIQASTHVVSSAYQQAAPLATGGAPGQSKPGHAGPYGSSQSQARGQDMLYAVFTTPTNSIGGSAICAYRMQDILAAFEGPFKSQADSNSNWLPVPESRVPQPRPGTCTNDSKRLPEEHINFIKDNPLMDTAIEPVWSQPLITMASINFRFTQVVVDAQVETQQVFGAPAMRTDVIFVSTDDGRVFKLINTYHLSASSQAHKVLASPHGQPPAAMAMQAGHQHGQKPLSLAQQQQQAVKQEPLPDVTSSTIVIEELHLFDSRTPILDMLIHRPTYPYQQQYLASSWPSTSGKLVVLSAKQIKAIPLARCERALSCQDCLALYDPYCAWDMQQQVCMAVGRSQVISSAEAAYLSSRLQPAGFASRTPPPGWFPPNVHTNSLAPSLMANNYTLGWWSSCPVASNHLDAQQQQQLIPQVGAPVRSLFSSHLQVPSRFDYQSGHHLSRTALISLPQMIQAPSSPPSSQSSQFRQVPAHQQQQQQPVSECQTFCGGVYTSSAIVDPGQQHNLMSCAEIIGSNSLYLQSAGPGGVNFSPAGTNTNLYTSENLYSAVIICAILGLVLGLLFGFAIGKNARTKNESSICSSTFDETNLYMASTGSHCHPGGVGGTGLFAAPMSSGQQHSSSSSTAARLANHPAFLAQHHQAGYAMAPAGRSGTGAGSGMFDASQCLLTAAPSDQSSGIGGSSTYTNQRQQQQQQQQLLLHLAASNKTAPATGSPSTRTGALPPIPGQDHQQKQQQPLVNTTNHHQATHLNQAQLTPNSNSSGSGASQSSSATSSSSTTVPASEHHQHQNNQFYLNQQQLILANHQQQQHQVNKPLISNNNNSLHQRSFTNGSIGSEGGSGPGKMVSTGVGLGQANGNSPAPLPQHKLGTTNTGSSFQPGQQQQQANNNKIYL